MKEKIIALLEKKQIEKVEAKAEARGFDDIWKLGLERALLELGDQAEESALARRAAERAQQIVGCIPRIIETRPDDAQPGEQAGGDLPPIKGRRGAKAKAPAETPDTPATGSAPESSLAE